MADLIDAHAEYTMECANLCVEVAVGEEKRRDGGTDAPSGQRKREGFGRGVIRKVVEKIRGLCARI